MGRGIDRNGPDNDVWIVSPVTLIEQDNNEDDFDGSLWMENIEDCIFHGLGFSWKKPEKKEWVSSGGWSRKDYYVFAKHDGALEAMVVSSTDSIGAELFVVVNRDRCDNPGIQAIAQGFVDKWCKKLREGLKPMNPSFATSSYTSAPLFVEENTCAQV